MKNLVLLIHSVEFALLSISVHDAFTVNWTCASSFIRRDLHRSALGPLRVRSHILWTNLEPWHHLLLIVDVHVDWSSRNDYGTRGWILSTGTQVRRPVFLLAGIVTVRSVPATVEKRFATAHRAPLFFLYFLDASQSLVFRLLTSLCDCS